MDHVFMRPGFDFPGKSEGLATIVMQAKVNMLHRSVIKLLD